VDDGSSDGTAAEALRRPIWVIQHPMNLGQGAALQSGICFALKQGAEYIVTFDADGQHNPGDIGRLVESLILHHADYALGSRFLGTAPGIPWTRWLLLRLAVVLTRVMSGISVTDTHNGIRAMTRRGAEQIRITLDGMEHASEILEQIAASGLRLVEVPVQIRYSAGSLAKGQKGSGAFRLAAKLLVERIRQ